MFNVDNSVGECSVGKEAAFKLENLLRNFNKCSGSMIRKVSYADKFK